MNQRSAGRLAWKLWALAVAIGLGSLYVLRLNQAAGLHRVLGDPGFPIFWVIEFATLGLIVASRRPSNPIGWLFCWIGLLWSVAAFVGEYGRYGLLVAGTHAPAASLAAALDNVLFVAAIALIAYPLMWFPDGQALSPRWRLLPRLTTLAIVLASVGAALTPGPMPGYRGIRNPLGLPQAMKLPIGIATGVGIIGVLAAVAASAVSLILRLRRSSGQERQRIRVFAHVASICGILIVPAFISYNFGRVGQIIAEAFLALIFTVIPVAAAVSILKYRLYDIDLAISKTVAIGSLAGFITIVYVAIVRGVGSLFGRGSNPNVALSIVATAIVAVTFQPVRAAVQRFANRLVHGERATPYEVMAGFARAMAGTLSVEAALPEMAEAAARGVGAVHSRVRLFLADGDESAVAWPEGEAGERTTFTRTIEVNHGGEPVGEIAVAKPPGEPLTPAEEKLLGDLAQQAGLALHNVALAFELQERVLTISAQAEELRRSRQRLVTARDAQRRSLERDIRDGAQHQLLEIERKLDRATGAVEDGPDEATQMLDALEADANAALESLRDLARGIFPPLLADEGIHAALEAHVRKVMAPAVIEFDPPELEDARFDPDTEAAVYFCCVQALQNVARHAGGARATVRITRDDAWIEFAITDDGPGFDVRSTSRGMGFQIMTDRMEALGGTLSIRSAPNEGSTVTGRIPAREEARVGRVPSKVGEAGP